jgi:myo-inositol-1(or 4)-monophosphatase
VSHGAAPDGRGAPDPAGLRALAVAVACEAGDVLLEHRERTLQVDIKTSATDPVTQADRASEDLIARRLLAARPDDGLLGEEDRANRRGSSGLRWVVDPLDATVNFTYRLPHWCVSIAVEDDEGPLAGVVHDPVRGEVFAAARGRGASLDDRPLHVSEVDDLHRVLVATGFAYDPAVRADQGRDVADLLGRVRDVRRGGSAALDLAYVAAGRVDGYVEFGLQPWDWAAGRLLVTEAGGHVSTHRRTLGGEVREGIVAGGPTAHDALAAWVRERSEP